MDGFWKQTLCHFKLDSFGHNYDDIKDMVELPALAVTIALVFSTRILVYLPLSLYKAFAPHRVMRRLKAIKESQ